MINGLNDKVQGQPRNFIKINGSMSLTVTYGDIPFLTCLDHCKDTAFLTGEIYEDDMICSDEISGRIRNFDSIYRWFQDVQPEYHFENLH